MSEFGFTHEPYRDGWGENERDLWDTEPNTYRELYSADEWEQLQEAFHNGWLETDMSKEQHEQWREMFYDISGVEPQSFDWEAYREYWAEQYADA